MQDPIGGRLFKHIHWAMELRKADILLQALDARDPLYCRCAELEAWAKQ